MENLNAQSSQSDGEFECTVQFCQKQVGFEMENLNAQSSQSDVEFECTVQSFKGL
jgi:hypothetical protein